MLAGEFRKLPTSRMQTITTKPKIKFDSFKLIGRSTWYSAFNSLFHVFIFPPCLNILCKFLLAKLLQSLIQ